MMRMKNLPVIWEVGLLALLVTQCAGKTTNDATHNDAIQDRHMALSLFAQQTLFDEMGEDGLTKMRGVPVPLYREDLPDNYIAYWEVEYDTDYMIVNSGQQTGDYDILINGKLPTQTHQIRDDARRRGSACFRYYVLTSTGAMMCKDKNGRVVGTNLPEYVFSNSTDTTKSQDSTTMHDYIKSRSDEQAVIWQVHAERVRDQQMGNDDENDDDEIDQMWTRLPDDDDKAETKPKDKHVKESHLLDGQEPAHPSSGDGTFRAQAITPGSPLQIVIGNRDAVTDVRIRYIITGPEARIRAAGLKEHTNLCQVTKGCDAANENYAEMSPDLTADHATYFDLELDLDTTKVFKGDEFVFALDIVSEKEMTTRYFAVAYQSRREKRRAQYKPWTSWSVWSIPLENYFPDYNQFKDGKCQVGCGPVAWAMVFGYYDRRDHNSGSYSGSMNLYRSGSDGTTGSSSAIAPKYNDARMTNYIKHLNNVLGTFCLFGSGATLAGKMPKAENFFKARQTTGSPDVIEKRHWLTMAGIYSDKVENWAKDRLKEGRPVILGWRAGSYLSWHYPVATKVMTRTRRWRRCGSFFCRWKTQTETKVYMHMGWGGSSNNWYNLQAYYAVTAKY